MSGIYTAQFWKDTGERVLATFLQTAIGMISIDQMFSIGLVGWKGIAAASAAAAIVALVKAILAGGLGVPGTASLTSAVVPAPAPVRPAVTIGRTGVTVDLAQLGDAVDDAVRGLRR